MAADNKLNYKLETDLNTLRSFVAIVEEGGFSAAARRVHRTQSAISVQIAKLEDRLNTKLLERDNRPITVTPSGESFLSYAYKILELADEAVLAATSPEETTLLRVGFGQFLVPYDLHNLLARFRRAHPNCDFILNLGPGTMLLEQLDKGELDVVFAGPEAERGQMLWEEPLVWSGTTNLSDNPDDPIELIMMHSPCSFRKVAFDALVKSARPWKVSINANSLQAVQSAIRAGLGVSVMPLSSVAEDMPIVHDLPELPNTMVMSYVHPEVSHLYAQRLIDFLMESVNESIGKRLKIYAVK
jgi:DNA-binding transcriptional LysR family regulator